MPPACVACGSEGEPLCERCALPLRRRLEEPPGLPFGLPGHLPDGVLQLEWCAAFTGPVRAALHALKYDGIRRLAEPLGEALAERWKRVAAGGEVLVPVPIHARRRRERGFDQAELLARSCGAALGLPVVAGLRRREATEAQHSLGRNARLGNVRAAFEVVAERRSAIRDRWVVLVDDVVTTGATLAGCAAALDEAGALAVSALTVARER